jgi:hypothetical protein
VDFQEFDNPALHYLEGITTIMMLLFYVLLAGYLPFDELHLTMPYNKTTYYYNEDYFNDSL